MELKSKRVYVEQQEYFTVFVDAGATAEERSEAIAELEAFYNEYFGDESFQDVLLREVDDTGREVYRVKTTYSLSGTDLNPMIYPDAVWATDLIKR